MKHGHDPSQRDGSIVRRGAMAAAPDFIACIALFLIAFLVRGYGVTRWLLPNVDEIVLMNTLKLPFLEGCSASSVFWPAHLILKACYWWNTVMGYRWISVFLNSLAVSTFYLVAREFVSRPPAIFGSLVLCFQWYFVYIGRIVEIASFIPVLLLFSTWLLTRGIRCSSSMLVALAMACLGVGVNIWSPPCAYLSAAILLYLFASSTRGHVPWRSFIAAIVALLVTLSPYIWVVATKINLSQEIISHYGMTNLAEQRVFFANLLHPSAMLKTWTELLTFYEPELPWQRLVAIPALILFTPLLFLWARWKQQEVRYLGWLLYGQVFLCFVSPVPAYIEGHFQAVFLVLLLLLLIWAERGAGWQRAVPILSLASVAMFSMCFSARYFEDQRSALRACLDEIIAGGQSQWCMSDGARLKLAQMPEFAGMINGAREFTCAASPGSASNSNLDCCSAVLTTFDCNMDQFFPENRRARRQILTLNNLYEAHLSHGIRAWIIEKEAEPMR